MESNSRLRAGIRFEAEITGVTMTYLVLLAAVFLASSDPNWSRFRGPNGTGIAETSGLPSEFGPAKNVVWNSTVPAGHSSPVLTANRIFMTGVDGAKLVVFALDRASGKELWRREVPRRQTGRLENVNGPASPSPVTDGSSVYAFFQDFGVIAFTAEGKELWRLPLGPFNMFYGFGASPILVDGLVVLPVDQDTGSYLLGIDAKTGRQRYKVDRPGVISGYSTPTVYEPKGAGKQILIPESFQLSAYDVKDGHRVWWVRGLACEMKSVVSIEGDTAWVNGWVFPQNQPGQQVPTISWQDGLKIYDKNGDRLVADTEVTYHI